MKRDEIKEKDRKDEAISIFCIDGLFKAASCLRYKAWKVKKVKCTLAQVLRLCTGRTAHWGSRGIALFFLDHGTRRGWGVSVTLRPPFSPGKTRYPLYRRLGGPQGLSGQMQKISSPPGFDPQTAQPVASRYTDYATRPTWSMESCVKRLVNTDLERCGRKLA